MIDRYDIRLGHYVNGLGAKLKPSSLAGERVLNFLFRKPDRNNRVRAVFNLSFIHALIKCFPLDSPSHI